MNRSVFLASAALTLSLRSPLIAQKNPRPPENYPLHPDSERQPGVPAGTVTEYRFTDSKIFPGTERDYFIYVPAQYDADATKPACLMVFQDGKGFVNEKGASRIPIVFDNLIHKKEMPVTIGLFVNPGVVPALDEAAAQPRFNRSFEYDAVDGRYAEFLLEELLPEVDKTVRLSTDPNDRAICGSSSGAIAAFNVAWHRPDAFRRVYSIVGTFVGLRGGNEFPVLIRKTEPKPLRVFLQDGTNDNNIYCGGWWVANQDMLSAFEFSGYEINHQWGEGYHSQKHGGAIMPDVLRWLWKDHPKPVTTHFDRCRSRAPEFLVDGEDWELVSEGHGFTEGPAVAGNGDLFFTDLERGTIHRVTPDGKVSVFDDDTGFTNGLAFGPDGKTLYGCRREPGGIVRWDTRTGKKTVVVKNVRPNDVVVAHDGTLYFSEPRKKAIWFKRPGNEAAIASDAFSGVNGVVLSPDQSLLYAADFQGRYVWSAQIAKPGAGAPLVHVQPYFHLHLPPAAVDSRSLADGMCVTADGWVLVATAMGVQICDQPGRVNLILPPPPGARHPANLAFGGPAMQTLYATCGDKVFKRKLKLTGALPWQAPVKPPKPRL